MRENTQKNVIALLWYVLRWKLEVSRFNILLEALEGRLVIDTNYTGFSKAFDKLYINIIIWKFRSYGLEGLLLNGYPI